MRPCFSFVKYFLIILNVITFAVGGALAGLGIYALISIGSNPVLIGAVVVGIFAFLTAILGCCGFCTESRPAIIFYSIFTLAMTGGLIYLTMMAYKEREDLKGLIAIGLMDPNSLESWKQYCCTKKPDVCTSGSVEQFEKFCESILEDWLDKMINYIQIALISLTTLKAICTIGALYLCCVICCKVHEGHHNHGRSAITVQL